MSKTEAIPYLKYLATVQIVDQIEGGTPKDPNTIKTWLEMKGISSADVYQETVAAMGAEPDPDAVEAVADDVSAKGWSGFKSGANGLYIEARQIKAAFKEAANVCKEFLSKKNKKMRAARARLAERVWVQGTDKEYSGLVWLNAEEPSGTVERMCHAWTRQGKISSIKRADYVTKPKIQFELEVLNDGLFTEEVLRELLIYMGRNGIGANRSQGAGTFELIALEDKTA